MYSVRHVAWVMRMGVLVELHQAGQETDICEKKVKQKKIFCVIFAYERKRMDGN